MKNNPGDEIEVQTPEVRQLLRQFASSAAPLQKLSDGRSALLVTTTCLWIVGVIVLLRAADYHPLVAALCFLLLAALQHRCNIIQHEAIHRLLFRNRFLNDVIGHHLFGASILTPSTYRLYHFKHHRELGRESDPDFPGYSQFPATRRRILLFLVQNLLGLGVLSRFLSETQSALGKSPGPRTYHEKRGWQTALQAWGVVAGVQGFILGLFLLSHGSLTEFLIFWALPEITLTRALMAVRLIGEHTSRGGAYPPDVRYLVTLPSNIFERAFFAPLNFNYHAEHHLFPAVPWYNLRKLHLQLVQSPEYRRLVGIRKGYLRAVFRDCVLPETSA